MQFGQTVCYPLTCDQSRLRCYRQQPLTHDMAVELIVDGNGTHFDPAVVDAFLQTAAILRSASVEIGRGSAVGQMAWS